MPALRSRASDDSAKSDISVDSEARGAQRWALQRVAVARAALVLPAVALLVPFFLWPLAEIVVRSLTDPQLGFHNYSAVLGSEAVGVVMMTTLRIALGTTALCLILGLPYAHYVSRSSPRKAKLLILISTAPLWTIAIVRLYAWTVILGRRGLVNETLLSLNLIDHPLELMFNEAAVIVGMTHLMLPFMILVLVAGLKSVDHELMAASSTLGASKVQTLVRVYLPLVRPSVVTACILVFVISLGFYITPAILGGGPTITVSIYIERLVALIQWGRASAVSAVLLGVTLLLVFVADRIFGVRHALVGGSRR